MVIICILQKPFFKQNTTTLWHIISIPCYESWPSLSKKNPLRVLCKIMNIIWTREVRVALTHTCINNSKNHSIFISCPKTILQDVEIVLYQWPATPKKVKCLQVVWTGTSFQGHLVVFDNENKQIGWSARQDCNIDKVL